MYNLKSARSGGRVGLLVAIIALSATAAPTLAGSGEVLPAGASPKGYSLGDAAAATAVYNTGHQTGNPATPPPPNVPFSVLVSDTNVKPGTMLYVPIFYADNSPPILGDFPADVTNQAQDVNYWFNPNELGFQYFFITVDGKTTIVGSDYVAGAMTAPLLDGGGNAYTTVAVFLTPLTPGTHTVSIGASFDSALIGNSNGPFIAFTYSVTVEETKK